MNNKILLISGPTASGKTALALKLAKQFNGELISADSRQVYKGMEIITGKDIANAKFQSSNVKCQKDTQTKHRQQVTFGYYELKGEKLWGLDLVEPDQEFDVHSFVKTARTIITDIESRGKLPIIVGGTYFYIKNLLQPADTIGVPINQSLRQELSLLGVNQLQQKLEVIDPDKWQGMNNSDRNNPRRLVRAIEVGEWKRNYKLQMSNVQLDKQYHYLWVGLIASKDIIKQRIERRVEERIKQGAEKEVRTLIDKGFQWALPSMSGIGFRDFRAFIEGTQSLSETYKLWVLHEVQYTKRQIAFLKQQEDIHWLDISIPNYSHQAKVLVQKWLENS